MSYGEAKRLTRGAYLHWHRGTHGRRCWGALERKGNSANVRTLHRIAPLDETQQPKNELPLFVPNLEWVWDERQRAKNGPLLFVEPEPWVMLARFSELPAGNINSEGEFKLPVFSTFAPGTEPDVWPALEPETGTAARFWGAAVAGFLAALAAWAAWLTLAPLWKALVRAGVRS